MNRISKMLLLLILVMLPVILFILDNQKALAENSKDSIPIKEPAKTLTPVYSVFNTGE